MRNNSTSKMFRALGISAVVENENAEQSDIHEDTPRLTLSTPKNDMKKVLTHALGYSADKNYTPMD